MSAVFCASNPPEILYFGGKFFVALEEERSGNWTDSGVPVIKKLNQVCDLGA
jgi:hypothetical protein